MEAFYILSTGVLLFGAALYLWLRWESAKIDRRFGPDSDRMAP